MEPGSGTGLAVAPQALEAAAAQVRAAEQEMRALSAAVAGTLGAAAGGTDGWPGERSRAAAAALAGRWAALGTGGADGLAAYAAALLATARDLAGTEASTAAATPVLPVGGAGVAPGAGGVVRRTR